MKNLEIVFPAKEKVELWSYEDPPLEEDEVRGPTLASVDSPGAALAHLSGHVGHTAGTFPKRPGHGAVFEVQECGSDVSSVAPGDRLLCLGESRSTKQRKVQLTVPVPDGLDAGIAVLARLMGVSMTSLMTTPAAPGDLIVVCGVGPVGYLAAHMCRISGFEVAVVDPDPHRRKLVEASGISRTYPEMPLNDPEIAGKAALVVECSGYESAVRDGFRVVRTGGEVVLVGTPWRRLTDTYAFDICRDVFFKFAVLRSGWEFEIPLHSRAFADMGHNSELFNNALHSYFPGLTKCLNWLVQGKIPLDGLIRKASPKEAPEIYRALSKREIEELFVVWDWTSV